MPKSRMLFILLGLWLFAIITPSVLTLIDVDKPVVVSNLNEEEQQEQGKKAQAEEKMFSGNATNLSLLAKLKNSVSKDFCHIEFSDCSIEIVLPPPEYRI